MCHGVRAVQTRPAARNSRDGPVDTRLPCRRHRIRVQYATVAGHQEIAAHSVFELANMRCRGCGAAPEPDWDGADLTRELSSREGARGELKILRDQLLSSAAGSCHQYVDVARRGARPGPGSGHDRPIIVIMTAV